MTTSQASRVFAIPYNSLLMYVRGKYGKSLKLDLLKAQTPAATDNLNTIGNSRSTPKEKAHFNEGKKAAKAPAMPAMLPSPGGGLQVPPALPVMPPQSSQPVSLPPHPTGGPLGLNPFAAFQGGLQPHLQDGQMGAGLLGHDASRIRDLMLNLQREQHPMLAAAAAAAAAAASSQQSRSPASTPTRPDHPAGRPGSATPDGGGTPEKVTSSVAAVAQFAAAVQQHQQQLQRQREENDNEGDDNDDVFDDDMPVDADIERNEDVAIGGEVAEVTKEVGSEDKEKASSDNNAGVMTGSSGEEEQMEEEDIEEPTPAPAENANAFQGLPEISA